ncbi:ATP-binding cassette domain-containing protein [Microbacterium sp. NPDC003461]
MSHPHAGGPALPLPAAVRASTPTWVMGVSAGIAWAGAIATALLFAWLGRVLDGDEPGWAVPVACAAVAAVCAGAGPWFSQWAGSEAEGRLRRAVVGRVFDLGVAGTAGRSGQLLSVATDGVERTAHYRAGFLGPILGALTTPLIVLGVMALTADAVTAGWLALLILLVPVLIGGFRRLVRPIGAAYRRTQGRLTAGFLEAIQALDTLVYARAAERVADDLAARGEEHRRGLMRMLAGNQLLILVVDAAFSLTVVVAATVIAATRAADGAITAGAAVAIVLMTVLVIGPVDVIGSFFYIGIGGRAAQQQIAGHLSGGPRSSTGGRAVPGAEMGRASAASRGQAPPGSIVLERVTAGYPGGEPVLRGLSLRVEPGERVALVGPSGIGKSTVSALVQAHLRPSAGTVLVDGLDASETPADEIRARLAVVEQRPFLFLGSIAENLRLAAPSAPDERLWHALEVAGLRAEVERMPGGLDTPVGEHGALLSGGQAQRLAIARAALRDAPILVLDEPTSQVDLAGEAAILAALDRLAAGRTVLMIAHRPGAILAADRVIALGAEAGA